MNYAVGTLWAAIMAAAAGPVNAADWWLVSGVPVEQAAMFADVETLARQDDAVSLRVLRIDRAGRSSEALRHVECGGRAESGGDDALRNFACASDQDRERFGLILAGMSPGEVARMIFGIGATDGPQAGPHPRG